jgi:transcriptional regulator with XRE-family HTH domain
MTVSPGGDTPAVARQRVRRELRRARRGTELTQTDVARQIGWSLSKVQRIESGEVAVGETDLRALLDLYGVTANDVVTRLSEDARLARRERWSTRPEYRKFLTPGLRRLLQFEVVATQIRAYQPFLLPGVLQTPATAERVINLSGSNLTPDERRVRFELRMRRRKDLIDNPDGPSYYLVIDEAVLLRNIGGDRIVAEQLEDLAEVAANNPRVVVRIVPLTEGHSARIGMLGPFTLMSLSDDEDDSVLYREAFIDDHLDHDIEVIRPFRDAFERLWELSLPEAATVRAIQAASLQHQVRLDRLPTADN